MKALTCALVLLLIGVASRPAGAQVARRAGTFGGQRLSFWVAYPDGYAPGESYPTVVVFGGGPQTFDGARRTLEAAWRDEARRRGYVVVAPGTPDGQLFFMGADVVFPGFLDYLIGEFDPPGGRLHVAGPSNGGTTAFHIAARYPERVATVVGYPGVLDGPDVPRLAALDGVCVFMHVGDRDADWRNLMRQQAEAMRARGIRVALTVEPGQNHGLDADELDLSRRFFDEIESCAP